MEAKEFQELIKLQAFIDYASGTTFTSELAVCVGGGVIPWLTADCGPEMVVCFIRMAILNTLEYRRIAALLRQSEAYSIVLFMLREGQGAKIEDLSRRYGVSSGHFRRLLRTILGISPKSMLRQWRLAAAILDLIDRRQTITEVAMDHGYASSSHFSSEVKKTLGLSLTNLLLCAQRKS